MTDLAFWGMGSDSLELLAETLKNDLLVEELFERGYVEPTIDSKDGVCGIADTYYFQRNAVPMSHLKRIRALKRYDVFIGNSDGSSLVGICFFAAIQKVFNQLFFVATKQKYVGIYMDGVQIAQMPKSNPVVLPDTMRPYLLGTPEKDLELFCDELSQEAKAFLGGVQTFAL